jgi:hypothetical protein
MNQGIYNEIQAGSYLLLDDCYNKLGLNLENSLFVLSTVVSSKENLIVIDAGVKTVGIDQGLPSITNLTFKDIVASEEHFQIHNPNRPINIGEKLKLIPGHCCSTMNLHDSVYLVSGNEVIKNRYAYGCRDYQNCKFRISTQICGRWISKSNVEKLLSEGVTSNIEGFVSKNGKNFNAKLKLDEEKKVIFDFSN